MDAMYAMLSYDHHRDNGLQELKIPQSRTGLGDEIMQASFMCDEWNSQSEGDCTCAPKSPSSTTSLSWVRPQIHIQIRLLCSEYLSTHAKLARYIILVRSGSIYMF